MELKPCPCCGAQPEKETRKIMLGKIQDGGYPCIDGRIFCPVCGFGPDWGKCYSIHCGWDKNIEVWNECVNKNGP